MTCSVGHGLPNRGGSSLRSYPAGRHAPSCGRFHLMGSGGALALTESWHRETRRMPPRTFSALVIIQHGAGPRSVSSFLNEAARERLARLELRGLPDELDARYGAGAGGRSRGDCRDARRIFCAR